MPLILGIDRSYGWVFEGTSQQAAHLIWPQPVMTPAKLITNPDVEVVTANTLESKYYFREDSFDPVSRVRRGRIYEGTGAIGPWDVIKTDTIQLVGRASPYSDRLTNVILAEYRPFKISVDQQMELAQLLFVLGTSTAFSIWHLLNVETIHTGEQLVTIKARQGLGVFPTIDWGVVPDAAGLVREKVGKLLDDVYRAVPESVVDRSREAATAILSAYLQNEGFADASGKDLGGLTELLDRKNGKNVQRIVRCAAEITQRLHSRGKHAEQEKHDDLRPIREQDAELAVQCIGVMLCDLGWASGADK
jgi:hypothetical protein